MVSILESGSHFLIKKEASYSIVGPLVDLLTLQRYPAGFLLHIPLPFIFLLIVKAFYTLWQKVDKWRLSDISRLEVIESSFLNCIFSRYSSSFYFSPFFNVDFSNFYSFKEWNSFSFKSHECIAWCDVEVDVISNWGFGCTEETILFQYLFFFLYGTTYLSCVVEWVESMDFKWVDSDLALNESQFLLESNSN